jgi:hypothetical protein
MQSSLKRAAMDPENGKTLSRGRPKKMRTVRISGMQEERASRNGISRRTQQKLDRIARLRPELIDHIAQGKLTISAAEKLWQAV